MVGNCVGDRNEGLLAANLFDIDSKYGHVVGLDEAIARFAGHAQGG